MAGPTLVELLAASPVDINRISDYFNSRVLVNAIADVNSNFSPFRLVKRPRSVEPLPTERRQLSSYRTRIGTMLEYSVSTAMHNILARRYNGELIMAFDVAHEYPDFYLRNRSLKPVLRLEMKAVDAESDEQAARFDVVTTQVDPARDLALFVGWEWIDTATASGAAFEYPRIFASTVIPAIEIAKECEHRLRETGSRIRAGKVYVPSKKHPGKFVLDPGNYGKFHRIIHRTRKRAKGLSPYMQHFERFLAKIEQHAAKYRKKK